MLQRLLICSLIPLAVLSSGEFSILHHPSSLLFKGHDHVTENTLKEIYSASLGFSTKHYSNWQGLYIVDPFNLAEALVTVSVDGASDIGLQKGRHYPLKNDADDSVIFKSLRNRIAERFPETSSHFVKINLMSGLQNVHSYDIFNDIKDEKPQKTKLNHLKVTVDEDREFLKEITLLNAIANKIEKGVVKKDFVPDVFWFTVSGLHAITDLYGENATATKEAKQLLNEAIFKINTAFSKAYKGSVLVNVITNDESHTRRTRSILATPNAKTDKDTYNLAGNYGEDYPAFFNIILWFGVIMVFSILAVCLAITNMDPGRDSIIYRMTSTRMKKDN